MGNLKKKDLVGPKNYGLTFGDLKEFIDNNPNLDPNTSILIERIEDKYFEGLDISGMSGCLDTKDGIFPSGSKSENWNTYKDKDDIKGECEYIPSWCIFKNKEDLILIDIHY